MKNKPIGISPYSKTASSGTVRIVPSFEHISSRKYCSIVTLLKVSFSRRKFLRLTDALREADQLRTYLF